MRDPFPQELTDAEIVRGIRNGDARAFDELHDRFAPLVRRACARILIRPEDVDDATQEVFLRAYVALRTETRHIVLAAWLKTLARNIAIDSYRRDSRLRMRTAESVDDGADELTPETVLIGGGPARLDEVMHRLPDQYATALRMRALEDLSHKELASLLGSTPARVKALLHRARRAALDAWEQTSHPAA